MRFVVLGTFFDDSVHLCCVAESPKDAIAQFHSHFGDQVKSFDTLTINLETEKNPAAVRLWEKFKCSRRWKRT